MARLSLRSRFTQPLFLLLLTSVVYATTFLPFQSLFSVIPPRQTYTSAPAKYVTLGQEIVLANTHWRYIPYGVFVGGILLANTDWRTNGATTYITRDAVKAAYDFWFSNMVSLQVAYEPLYPNGPDQSVDASYVAMIDKVVGWAQTLHMNVSIVLQEESVYGIIGKPVFLPTSDALTFWNYMANHYKNNPGVFFDLYNEPRVNGLLEPDPSSNDVNSCPAGTPAVSIPWDDACAWFYWKNGTTQGGVTYEGMNQLAQAIRQQGANNLIFAEGLAAGEDLAELANGYTIEGGKEFLLDVPNVVYAVHPYFGSQHDSATRWDRWFGTVPAKANVPVVASEWTLDQESGSGCEPDSITEIPQVGTFFQYLLSKKIGLVGWALQSGTLIRGWDFRNPTAFDSSTMPANRNVPPFSTNPHAQGVGQLLRRYFMLNSRPALNFRIDNADTQSKYLPGKITTARYVLSHSHLLESV